MKTRFLAFSIIMVVLSSGPFANANEACSQVLLKQVASSALDLILEKYNKPTVLSYRFSPEGLDQLQMLYHHLPAPKILKNILSGVDRDSSLLATNAPDYFSWNAQHDTFITVNPTYLKAKDVVEALNSGTVRSLKDRAEGVALITWYVHPDIANKADQALAADHYLVSILDLDARDIGYLKDLKKWTLAYLKKNFGVSEDKDKVRLDFHFPYAIETATLHLHARVNMPSLPIEVSKSYSIDDIIRYLESGSSTKQMILDRQNKVGPFYFTLETKPLLEVLQNGTSMEVPNPYYIKP